MCIYVYTKKKFNRKREDTKRKKKHETTDGRVTSPKFFDYRNIELF